MSEYDAKWIHVYQNKDPHLPGVRLMVSPSQIKDEDVLLSEITKKLQPPFGAVRKLHTPVNGSRIRKLSEIKTHRRYVAAGAEKFQQVPGGYMNIGQKNRMTHTKQAKVLNHGHCTLKDFRAIITTKAELNITIFRNGKPDQFKNLKYNEHSSIPPIYSILKDLNSALPLKKGTYKQIYTLNGRIVAHSSELESNSSYVAVPNYEWFKKAPYGQEKPIPITKKSSVSLKSNADPTLIEANGKSRSQTDLPDALLQETTEKPQLKSTDNPRVRSVSAVAILQASEAVSPLIKELTSSPEMGEDRKRNVSLQTEKPLRTHSSISNTLSLVLDLQNANRRESPEERQPAQMNNWLSPLVQEAPRLEKPALSTSLVGIFRAKKLIANFQRLPTDLPTDLKQEVPQQEHYGKEKDLAQQKLIKSESLDPPADLKQEHLEQEHNGKENDFAQQKLIHSESPVQSTKEDALKLQPELLAMQDAVETQQIARESTKEADRLMESFQSFLTSSLTTEKKFFKELQSYDNTSVSVPDKRVHFNLNEDPSGIWRAKTNLFNEAVEVPDSPHVTVDLPVDLKPTEIVQEEILAGRQKTRQAPVNTLPAVKA